jgi:hypothetical protein
MVVNIKTGECIEFAMSDPMVRIPMKPAGSSGLFRIFVIETG